MQKPPTHTERHRERNTERTRDDNRDGNREGNRERNRERNFEICEALKLQLRKLRSSQVATSKFAKLANDNFEV